MNTNILPPVADFRMKVVEMIVKRSEERKVFNRFLESEVENGLKVIESMEVEAGKMVKVEMAVGVEVDDDRMRDFVIENLKAVERGQVSTYERLVFDLIVGGDDRYQGLRERFLQGKLTIEELPATYPGLRKRAEGMLRVKIVDGIDGETRRDYLVRQKLMGRVRGMAKEMFGAINHFGLEGEKLIKYLRLMYELDMIGEDRIERGDCLRRMVAEALVEGKGLQMLNVKCLRFSYPKGEKLKLVTTLGEYEVEDKYGQRLKRDDQGDYFDNLRRVREIFERGGLSMSVTILVADVDLEYYGDGGGLFPSEDLVLARKDAREYLLVLQRMIEDGEQVVLLGDYLEMMGLRGEFDEVCRMIKRDLERCSGKLVSDRMRNRLVDDRFEANKEIFKVLPKRDYIRRVVFERMAYSAALSVLADGSSFLLAEPQGDESRLVAVGVNGSELPVVFVDFHKQEIRERGNRVIMGKL